MDWYVIWETGKRFIKSFTSTGQNPSYGKNEWCKKNEGYKCMCIIKVLIQYWKLQNTQYYVLQEKFIWINSLKNHGVILVTEFYWMNWLTPLFVLFNKTSGMLIIKYVIIKNLENLEISALPYNLNKMEKEKKLI